MEKVWETSASRDTPSCRKGSSVTGRPEKVRVGGGVVNFMMLQLNHVWPGCFMYSD